eukprot:scaffold5752_cov334-Prasinococcus_capsulatus_cf.AAC.1
MKIMASGCRIDLNEVPSSENVADEGSPTSHILSATTSGNQSKHGYPPCDFCKTKGHKKAQCPAISLLRAFKTKAEASEDKTITHAEMEKVVSDWKERRSGQKQST